MLHEAFFVVLYDTDNVFLVQFNYVRSYSRNAPRLDYFGLSWQGATGEP